MQTLAVSKGLKVPCPLHDSWANAKSCRDISCLFKDYSLFHLVLRCMVEIVLASALTCNLGSQLASLCTVIHMAAYKNWLTNTDGSIGGTRVEGHIGVTGMQHNHKRLYSLLHCSVIHDCYGNTYPVWAGVDCNLMWRFFIVFTSWNTDGTCITSRAETKLCHNNSIFIGAHKQGAVFI